MNKEFKILTPISRRIKHLQKLERALDDPGMRWTDIVRQIDDQQLLDFMELYMRAGGIDEKAKRCFVERCKILEFEALKDYSDKERELRLEETMRKQVRRPDPKDEAYYAQYIKSK